MQGMLAQVEAGLNAAYVYEQLDAFLCQQNLKSTILRAAEMVYANTEVGSSSKLSKFSKQVCAKHD